MIEPRDSGGLRSWRNACNGMSYRPAVMPIASRKTQLDAVAGDGGLSGGAARHGGQQDRRQGDAQSAERHESQFDLAARDDAGQQRAAADAEGQHGQQRADVLLVDEQVLRGELIDVDLRQRAERPEIGASQGRQKQRPLRAERAEVADGLPGRIPGNGSGGIGDVEAAR